VTPDGNVTVSAAKAGGAPSIRAAPADAIVLANSTLDNSAERDVADRDEGVDGAKARAVAATLKRSNTFMIWSGVACSMQAVDVVG